MSASIIRVHGTFAGFKYETTPEDRKKAWHRRDSAFCTSIKEDLGTEEYFLANDFHWDGENLSSARNIAAKSLLKQLLRLEEAQTPYHIVAHSHGGTVVWKALMMAERRKWRKKLSLKPGRSEGTTLKNLRSWTTFGTPFIMSKLRVSREVLALITQILVLALIGIVTLFAFLAFTDWPDQYYQHLSIALTTVIFIAALGLFFQFSKAMYYYVSEAIKPAGTYRESLRKWVGLISPDDEALRGLEFASSLRSDLVAGSSDTDDQFLSKGYFRFRKCVFFPLSMLNRFVVIPVTNIFIRLQLKKIALGDNDRFQHLYGVGMSPLRSLKTPLLPKDIVTSLRTSADEALREIVPSLRDSLATGVTAAGSASEDVDFKVAASVMTGDELVHTSYYNHGDVVGLTADHIRISDGAKCRSKRNEAWLKKFKANTQAATNGRWWQEVPLILVWVFAITIAVAGALLLRNYGGGMVMGSQGY